MTTLLIERLADDARQLNGLAIGVDELLDNIRAEPSASFLAVRAIVNAIIEKSGQLERQLDNMDPHGG